MTGCVRKHKNMYTSKTAQYSWHDTHTQKKTDHMANKWHNAQLSLNVDDAGSLIGLQTGRRQVKDHISTHFYLLCHQKCHLNSEFQVDKSEEPGQHQVPNSTWPSPHQRWLKAVFCV